MSQLSPELSLWASYAAPPVIGAFIGYLTNRVAIRMLFRPLRAWRVFGIRLPMTPGVIPSKRLELAENMGEVVGDHLLTSEEIGKGLQQEPLQQQLFRLIHTRVKDLLCRDLGEIASLVPGKFQVYLNLGVMALTWQVKSQIREFLASPQFEDILSQVIARRIAGLSSLETGAVLSLEIREKGYLFLEESLVRMFQTDAVEQWLDDFFYQKFYAALREEKSLAEIMPDSFPQLSLTLLEKQIPLLLEKAGELFCDREVRERLVAGVCTGVDAFIDSLGTASDMVRNFLDMNLVEEKIRQYLTEKEGDITAWIQSEEMRQKVAGIVHTRCQAFFQKPLTEICDQRSEEIFEEIYRVVRGQLLSLLRSDSVPKVLASLFRTGMESEIESGGLSVGGVVAKLFGNAARQRGQEWLTAELCTVLRSESAGQTVDSMVDSLMGSLLQKKIGRLDKFVPAGVVDGVAHSLQKLASKMLESEVPALVESLGIRKIVTEKINSLDLLRLERLLLSIMEEQFKYINLFGALLGFLIGCLNLVVLLGR